MTEKKLSSHLSIAVINNLSSPNWEKVEYQPKNQRLLSQ